MSESYKYCTELLQPHKGVVVNFIKSQYMVSAIFINTKYKQDNEANIQANTTSFFKLCEPFSTNSTN